MKHYDSTVARIAGNIAAGLVGSFDGALTPEEEEQWAVDKAIRMAKAIVAALTVDLKPNT